MPVLHRYFVSYCRENAEDALFALRLARDLRALGVEVWIDQLDLAPGMNLSEILEESVALLLIASPDAIRSPQVQYEFSVASTGGKRIQTVLWRVFESFNSNDTWQQQQGLQNRFDNFMQPQRAAPPDFRTNYYAAFNALRKEIEQSWSEEGGPQIAGAPTALTPATPPKPDPETYSVQQQREQQQQQQQQQQEQQQQEQQEQPKRSGTKLKPLRDRILVQRVEKSEKTSGGIIIPDTAKEKSQQNEILIFDIGKIDEQIEPFPSRRVDVDSEPSAEPSVAGAEESAALDFEEAVAPEAVEEAEQLPRSAGAEPPPTPEAPPPPPPTPTAAPQTTPAQLTRDNVQFTLTGPAMLAAGDVYELLFWVHVEEQRASVLARAASELRLAFAEMAMKSEGPYPLERGTRLSVRLEIAGLSCVDNYKWITWTGEIGKTTFVVDVPADVAQKAYVGSASIRLNDCEIARMSFVVRVGGAKGAVGKIPSTTRAHRKAFASYASEDRQAVLERVQGMEKLGAEVFVDVMSLRSGDNWESELVKHIADADVFYLFWCHHAKASEWVGKEWRLALQAKGPDFIDPVPLESPQQAPPPDELSGKHFNAPVLAFIAAAGGHLG